MGLEEQLPEGVLLTSIEKLAGYAQKAPAPTSNGPLVLERIHNDWVVAPDYKITKVDELLPWRWNG